MEEEENILIAGTGWPGKYPHDCADCGSHLLLTQKAMEMAASGMFVKIVCVDCAMKEAKADPDTREAMADAIRNERIVR